MGMAAENSVAFGVNEALTRAFPDDPATKLDPTQRPDLLKPFAMGTITGCCSATVLIPSEIIKAKTQVVVGHSSSNDILKEMLRRQGIKVSRTDITQNQWSFWVYHLNHSR
jgi:solute carrier family 25 ornithine transporter 2/15